MTAWPLIERPLCDHLAAHTNFSWTNDGGRNYAAVPLGIVQVAGGSNDLDLEDSPSVEVTLRAKTRDGLWQLAQQVDAAFAGLNPGGLPGDIYVDAARAAFRFTVDPDLGTADYKVATATYSLTLRPQGEANQTPRRGRAKETTDE